MSDIICEKCGYKTFVAYALKDDKGRLICPQCGELYEKDPTTLKSSFKFKQEDKPSPQD